MKRFVLASARALETILEDAHSFVGPILKPPTEADRMADHNIAFHQPADTGTSYWGPGDRYTFLVTGAQNNGAYFIMEGIVPPGGGPPLHIHHREEESLYLLDGVLEITLGEKDDARYHRRLRANSSRSWSTDFTTPGPRRRGCCSFSHPLEWRSISRKYWSGCRTAPPPFPKLQKH